MIHNYMKFTKLLLIAILFLFFLYTSRSIIAGDAMFLYDQSREIMLVDQMVTTHKLSLIGTRSGVEGLFHGPLWLYIITPFYLMGNGNPLYLSYAYILLMLTTIFVGFLVGKSLYNTTIGLLVAFFIATDSFLWQHLTLMHGLFVLPLLYLGVFYFLIRFLRGSKNSFIVACFFAGLTMQFETSSSLILIGLLPILLLLLSWCREKFLLHKHKIIATHRMVSLLQKNVLFFILCLAAIGLSLSTFILFDLRHNFLIFNSLVEFFDNTKPGHLPFLQILIQHLLNFLTLYRTIPFYENLLFTVLYVILLLAGGYFIFIQKHKEMQYKLEMVFFFFFPVLMFIPFLFYIGPVYKDYIMGLIIPIILALSLLIYNLWKITIGKVIVLLFFIVSILAILITLFTLYTRPYYYNQTAGSLRNQEAAVDWIYQDAKGSPFSYFVYSTDTFTYSMDYLMSWKGDTIYHDHPGQTKMATTYLIMYTPLKHDNNAHEFWKKNVIHTNAPVQVHKVFTGNIVVEKLHIKANEQPVDPNYFQQLIFR